jgi:two-component system cell cycle sensor histidine kinase/response regulator CckA
LSDGQVASETNWAMGPLEKISAALDSAKNSPRGYLPRPGDTLPATEIFRSLINSFPDAILVADPDFRILMSSGKAQQVLMAEDPTGKRVSDFLEMHHAEQLPQVAAKSVKEGSATAECLLLCANGTRFRSVWRLSPILGGDGKPLAFAFRLEDKRELGRPEPELATLARNVSNLWAEEALIESEQRYRIVTETAIDAIATIDESGQILFVNRSAERIFGYSAADMLGFNLSLLLPAYTSGIPEAREFTGRHQDGHDIFLEVSFGAFTQGSRVLATGVLRNVSRWRCAEEKLRHANETLRALIEATPLAIVAIDSDENVSKWNSAAEKMFGWSESEVLGRPLPSDPSDQRGWPVLREAARLGASITKDATRRRKDGTLAEVTISAGPLAGRGGVPAGAVSVITDIAERQRLEEQLRQAQKMDAVGRLAGGVAHDFNNLLTVIIGYGEMLLNGLAADTRQRDYALEILRAAEKAGTLTKQLLAFSRRQVTYPVLLDINPVVTGVSNMLRRLIGEDVELVLRLNPTLGTVRADPGQIEQIIINLVVNARDAMPGGGRITIETGLAELGDDYAQTHLDVQPGRYVCISVTDTGCGMAQTTQGHIFEPFFTTKDVGKGTGLGLSTIYGIVKQNNGSIWVYSEPGKGSAFKIYLPAMDEQQQAEPLGSRAVLERGDETILLVEDESGLREMAQELLEGQGYTVLPAADSQEAMRICSGHTGPVHLVLTDVVLPTASGHELAQRLLHARSQIRVLFMSGYPADTIVQRGLLEPGAVFLEKPFTPEALAKKVRQVLDGKDN